MSASTLKLLALVLPLGLDTFGVALALGLAGLPANRRLRLALLFAAFETGMPLLGVALGVPLGHAIGSVADYVAGALVLALGVYMLVSAAEEEGADRLLAATASGGFALLALGVSVSLDELAIGFSAGLLRLPVLALVLAVGVQAFVVTQLGVRLGARVGESWREASEKLAGLGLLLLGGALVVEQAAA